MNLSGDPANLLRIWCSKYTCIHRPYLEFSKFCDIRIWLYFR